MQTKTTVKLVYVSNSKATNGSPQALELEETVKCDLMQTFSANYYQENQRIMRLSRNIAVQVKLTEDRIYNGNRYELTYVVFDGLRYKVENVLNHRKSSLLKILDVQELR